jgi:hypothetical protein
VGVTLPLAGRFLAESGLFLIVRLRSSTNRANEPWDGSQSARLVGHWERISLERATSCAAEQHAGQGAIPSKTASVLVHGKPHGS